MRPKWICVGVYWDKKDNAHPFQCCPAVAFRETRASAYSCSSVSRLRLTNQGGVSHGPSDPARRGVRAPRRRRSQELCFSVCICKEPFHPHTGTTRPDSLRQRQVSETSCIRRREKRPVWSGRSRGPGLEGDSDEVVYRPVAFPHLSQDRVRMRTAWS